MVKRKQDKEKVNEPNMAQKQVKNIIKKEVEDKDNGKSRI